MSTRMLARFALASLSFLAVSTLAVRVEAGIIIKKNGSVFVGRIDLEDIKKETKDGKETIVSITMHDPRTHLGGPKTSERNTITFPYYEIRWFDQNANEPTDEYMKDHENEVIDSRYSQYIEIWRSRKGGPFISEDPGLHFTMSKTGLSPIPTSGPGGSPGYAIRKPTGWKSKIENDILIFESQEKGFENVTPRIQCFMIDSAPYQATERLKWIKDEIRRLATGDSFEINEGDNSTPKSVKNGYDVEWVTSTRRVVPFPRTIRALRQIHFRDKKTYFVTCYAHEKDFDANRLLFSACAKSLELDEDVATTPAGSPDTIDSSGVKIGQIYRWKSSAVPDQLVWEITQSERTTVAHKSTLATSGGEKKLSEGDVEQLGPLDPVARMVAVTGTAGLNPQNVKQDKIEVSGVTFDCNVYEAEANGKKYRVWLSKKFPVEIKLTIDGSIERELAEIK